MVGAKLFSAFFLAWMDRPVEAWNSWGAIDQVYSYEQFYSDAQYGPDFGYYGTGAIVHEQAGGHSFNSYTTAPISVQPWFAHLIAERIYNMWGTLSYPDPFFVFEFGGGTGVFARDILRHIRDFLPDLYHRMYYILGDRSPALRKLQTKTTQEFGGAKVQTVNLDARGHVSWELPFDMSGTKIKGDLLMSSIR